MRVSADRDDPDYFGGQRHKGAVRVFLNGTEIKNVLEADDVAGYVIHHPFGDDGKRVRIEGGSFVTERLVGKVEIVPKRFSGVDRGAS